MEGGVTWISRGIGGTREPGLEMGSIDECAWCAWKPGRSKNRAVRWVTLLWRSSGRPGIPVLPAGTHRCQIPPAGEDSAVSRPVRWPSWHAISTTHHATKCRPTAEWTAALRLPCAHTHPLERPRRQQETPQGFHAAAGRAGQAILGRGEREPPWFFPIPFSVVSATPALLPTPTHTPTPAPFSFLPDSVSPHGLRSALRPPPSSRPPPTTALCHGSPGRRWFPRSSSRRPASPGGLLSPRTPAST